MKETDLQKVIIQYLKLHKIYHLRLNSGKILASYKDKKRMINLCPEGTPDIMLIKDGKTIFLELKSSPLIQKAWVKKIEAWKRTAYLSDYNRREVMQYKAMQEIIKAGAEVHLVASLDEVIQIIESMKPVLTFATTA